MSPRSKPAWASARSNWRIRPLPPIPVSKRTMPPSAATAQTLPCGTPGQGSAKRSLQTPGRTFSTRGASGRLRSSAIAAAHYLPGVPGLKGPIGAIKSDTPRAGGSPSSDRLVAGMESNGPKRAGLVLLALILVAAVANLNLAVANVALPDIGKAIDSSQTTLNLIAVGYSFGLAASVLYLGALGDRYGRKMMLLGGVALSIPACLLAAYAPSDGVLAAARVLGGLSAGMAYPTTLALITALWAGQPRTRSIALWSAIGGGISALGPLIAGALLEHFWWGSVFLITLPLAVAALVLALKFVPAHVNEASDPVDNFGGIVSALMVGALILGINFLPVPDKSTLAVGLLVIAAAAAGAFVIRQRRVRNPLYDLDVAARRIFWVAACAG